MKKISILMAGVAMMLGFGFTSCKTDTQPRLDKPTEFVLNTPPSANNTVILAEDDEQGSTVDLTCSQPNYGVGVVTNYQVQISYGENDWAEGQYATIYTVNTQAKISIKASEFAVAMCELMGVKVEEDRDKFQPQSRDVYVRVKAFIPTCEYSEIYSNVIKMQVKPFFAVRVPGKLYVIGKVSGWDINNGAIYLSEPSNDIGSGVYTGHIPMTSDEAKGGFRFYTALGDWEHNSVGYQVDDNATTFTFPAGGVFESAAVAGKGSWAFDNWEDGTMIMTVNMSDPNNMSVVFEREE